MTSWRYVLVLILLSLSCEYSKYSHLTFYTYLNDKNAEQYLQKKIFSLFSKIKFTQKKPGHSKTERHRHNASHYFDGLILKTVAWTGGTKGYMNLVPWLWV